MLFLFAGCAPKHPVTDPPKEPVPGSFFDSQGKPLTESALLHSIKNKDFILIGESHDNPCDHHTQARVIELMAMEGQKYVLGLEMVSVERQEILGMFNEGFINVDQLPDMLQWQDHWGYDFELYRPIFDKARAYLIPVKALNLPSHVTRNISHHGLDNLPPEDKEYLPEKLIEPPEEQLQMLREQFELHEDLIQADQVKFRRFVAAQSAWDTKMAYEAVKALEGKQKSVIILAGTGHVAMGWGIEHRLRQLLPEARIAGIVPVRALDDIRPDNPFNYFCPPSRERMRLGIVAQEENNRVMVIGVVQGSISMEAGLEKGDEILRAGDKDISSLVDLHLAAVDAVNNNQALELEIMRNDKVKIIEIVFDSN